MQSLYAFILVSVMFMVAKAFNTNALRLLTSNTCISNKNSLTTLNRLFSTPTTDGATPAASVGELTELSRLEIRIGKIVEIGRHPEADGLYVEKVDIGEVDGPRTIVSGLVQYCTVEQLLNKNVVVLCNLKPRALKGIMSAGMLLCSSSADHTKVEPLAAPVGVELGTLITFAGHKSEPEPAGNRASKAFTKVADDLFVDDNGIATYDGISFMTPQGPITSSLKGKIS